MKTIFRRLKDIEYLRDCSLEVIGDIIFVVAGLMLAYIVTSIVK